MAIGPVLPDYTPPRRKAPKSAGTKSVRGGSSRGKTVSRTIAKPAPKPAPKPVRRVTTRTPSAPAPKPQRTAATASQGSSLGQNSLGSYSGIAPTSSFGGGSTLAANAPGAVETKTEPDVEIPTVEEFLGSDKIYNQEQASLLSALKSLAARYGSFQGDDGFAGKGTWTPGSEQKQYQQDYERNLRDLGWTDGGWNADDRLTSYGSSFNNQLEDYAARGMLDSSAYAQALTDLNRGFQDQYNTMNTARNNFIDDLQSNWLDAFRENQNANQRARIDAINRRRAQYGIDA